MTLPLFVVHGPLVWKLLLAALVGCSLGVVVLRRGRRERRRARDDVAAYLGTVSALEGGPVTLRGRITKGSVTTVDNGTTTTSERSPELWIDHEGEPIAIEGEVTVVHGTGTGTAWLTRATTRTAKAGDEVVIAGTCVRRVDDEASYRDGIGWKLSGESSLVAVQPRARPRALGPVLTAVIATALAIGWYGTLRIVGILAMKRAEARDRDETPTSLGNAVAIAAAMPGARGDALKEISWQLERRFERTEEVFQLRLAVIDLMGQCRAHALLAAVRLDEAVVAARHCNEGELASQALAFLGRFDEAWAEAGHDQRPFVVTIFAIATGRWTAAAAAAERYAVEQENRDRREYFTDADATRIATKARCFAALVRSWAGEANAFERVPGHQANDACRVYAALALPLAQQAAALEAVVLTGEGDYTLKANQRRLRGAAGGRMDSYEFGLSLSDVVGFGMQPGTWLAPFRLAAAPPDLEPDFRARILREDAALLAYRGDLAGARRQLAEAKVLNPDGLLDFSDELALALLDPTATIATENTGYVHPGIDEMVEARRGKLPAGDALPGASGDDCRGRRFSALKTAQAGDGAELASVIRQCRVYWRAQKYLLAIMPRITTHREELATAVRLFRNDLATYSLEHIPFRLLDDIVWYRDLARAIGDTDEAARWQMIFDRHAAILADRRKLTAMLLWQE